MKIISKNRLVLSAAISVCLAMSGCGKDGADFSTFKTWLLQCPNPFASHADDPVLARAGDTVVRVSEYQSYMQRMARPGQPSISFSTVDQHGYLDQILYRKMVTQLSRASGVQMDPFKRQMLEDMEFNFMTAALLKQIPVTDQEMSDYYKAHAQEFAPQDVEISHIAVKSPAQAPRLKALLQQGKSIPGMKKDKLAHTPSPGQPVDYVFLNAMSAMRPGQVSGPMKTPWGFEVVRRDVLPAPSFEAVKEQVRGRLQGQKLFAKTMSGTKVDVDDALLNSLSQTPNK